MQNFFFFSFNNFVVILFLVCLKFCLLLFLLLLVRILYSLFKPYFFAKQINISGQYVKFFRFDENYRFSFVRSLFFLHMRFHWVFVTKFIATALIKFYFYKNKYFNYLFFDKNGTNYVFFSVLFIYFYIYIFYFLFVCLFLLFRLGLRLIFFDFLNLRKFFLVEGKKILKSLAIFLVKSCLFVIKEWNNLVLFFFFYCLCYIFLFFFKFFFVVFLWFLVFVCLVFIDSFLDSIKFLIIKCLGDDIEKILALEIFFFDVKLVRLQILNRFSWFLDALVYVLAYFWSSIRGMVVKKIRYIYLNFFLRLNVSIVLLYLLCNFFFFFLFFSKNFFIVFLWFCFLFCIRPSFYWVTLKKFLKYLKKRFNWFFKYCVKIFFVILFLICLKFCLLLFFLLLVRILYYLFKPYFFAKQINISGQYVKFFRFDENYRFSFVRSLFFLHMRFHWVFVPRLIEILEIKFHFYQIKYFNYLFFDKNKKSNSFIYFFFFYLFVFFFILFFFFFSLFRFFCLGLRLVFFDFLNLLKNVLVNSKKFLLGLKIFLVKSCLFILNERDLFLLLLSLWFCMCAFIMKLNCFDFFCFLFFVFVLNYFFPVWFVFNSTRFLVLCLLFEEDVDRLGLLHLVVDCYKKLFLKQLNKLSRFFNGIFQYFINFCYFSWINFMKNVWNNFVNVFLSLNVVVVFLYLLCNVCFFLFFFSKIFFIFVVVFNYLCIFFFFCIKPPFYAVTLKRWFNTKKKR